MDSLFAVKISSDLFLNIIWKVYEEEDHTTRRKKQIIVPYVFYPVHPSLTVDHKPQKLVSTGILLYGVFASNMICQNEENVFNILIDIWFWIMN